MSGFPYAEDVALDRAAASFIAGPLTTLGLTAKDHAVHCTREVDRATGQIRDRRIVLHFHPDIAPMIPDFALPAEWQGFRIERRDWTADELGG